ncbi:VanZ family protein [[Clostridium] fimetarium]|uniref:Glycopeptide antibiotics resistance protein n=1 Tax=[Clostridium] fimetarium TaxID=99656 RepID=A0A1I0QX87_9FIRM|nr:VanZ family protein [[Clostridium] fimetarium]SEW31948.1 Glycopeptide antibiotics resistance protein [[Clostridium] fimetarium]
MLKFIGFAIILYTIFLILSVIYTVKHKTTFLELFCTNLFVIFILFVISITLFPIPIDLRYLNMCREHGYGRKNNFIPFSSIYHIISRNDLSISLRQVGGNFCMLIPLGIYAPLYFKGMNKIKNFFILALLVSAGIEFLQFFIGVILQYNYRSVDVDDIILNVSGSMIGYIIYLIIKPLYYKILNKNETKKE